MYSLSPFQTLYMFRTGEPLKVMDIKGLENRLKMLLVLKITQVYIGSSFNIGGQHMSRNKCPHKDKEQVAVTLSKHDPITQFKLLQTASRCLE